MNQFIEGLREATGRLPRNIQAWVSAAIQSDFFDIRGGVYEDRPSGAVCPVAAGAMLAGVWGDGRPKVGNPEWGTPDEPSDEVEDFAAYFDLCADALGVEGALEIVLDSLESALVDPQKRATAAGCEGRLSSGRRPSRRTRRGSSRQAGSTSG